MSFTTLLHENNLTLCFNASTQFPFVTYIPQLDMHLIVKFEDTTRKSTTCISPGPMAAVVNTPDSGDSESTPSRGASNQNVDPTLDSGTAANPIDPITSSTLASNISIDHASMNQDANPINDYFPAEPSYSNSDGFDSSSDNEPFIIFHTRNPPTPVTPPPHSRVKKGQDELFRQWGNGSFNSSPMGPPPGFYERNRKIIEKMCPLMRPTLYKIRPDYYRRLSKHVGRRAARVGRNMLEARRLSRSAED